MQEAIEPATCGAHTQNGPCRNVAGFRTPHYGQGRCYLHGGMTPRGPDSPHFRHGRRSRYAIALRESLRDKLDTLAEHDPFDVIDELQLQRALLLDFVDGKDGLTAADRELLMRWAEQISKTAERMTRMRNETAMTAAELKLIAARLADVVARHIADPEQQAAFLADLFASIGVDGR